MYWKTGILLFIILTEEIFGCHQVAKKDELPDYEDETEGTKLLRRKRQASHEIVPLLEEFFVSCMSKHLPQYYLDLATVVKFLINETILFEKTDNRYCRSTANARCWKSKLNGFLSPTSQLRKPAWSCIRQYHQDNQKGGNLDQTTASSTTRSN